ncbi:MAG TPA: tRNA (guanosine(46)-N7)-methyltransferase TrmB [Steroidobacteraceae bacterium]|nr:tRNA (guanosine(46)-N7)-methyltransferase TrmB [Steroidobacteraceae bacterium]
MHTPRRIRSFVLRAGRTTAAQERALSELWPEYGIDLKETGPQSSSEPLSLAAVFGREAPRCLEIGFGAGEVIGALAESNPHIDYIGIEVHRSGVGRLLLRAQQCALKNLRIICDDAVDVLKEHVADAAFDEMLVFFPDPWHKKRHHKRRLIDASFAALAADKLRAGGTLRLATDWQEYAEQMLAVCNASPALKSLSRDLTYVPRPEFRPPTRFERRGERLGHGVWDLAYAKRVREAAEQDEL